MFQFVREPTLGYQPPVSNNVGEKLLELHKRQATITLIQCGACLFLAIGALCSEVRTSRLERRIQALEQGLEAQIIPAEEKP